MYQLRPAFLDSTRVGVRAWGGLRQRWVCGCNDARAYSGSTGSISQLWHNNGDGTFTDVTTQAGLNPNNGDAHGAVWADFDNDGHLDLYISKGSAKRTRLTTMTYGTIMAMGPSLTSAAFRWRVGTWSS